jgi:hypothetical protein
MSPNRASHPVQIPLLIGITGHRDLLYEETAPLRAAVRSFLTRLQRRFPNVPLCLASSLSAGADQLVTEEALGLGIECIAVLPLPLDAYRKDFENPDELRLFEALLGRCRQRVVCPLPEGVRLEEAAVSGPARTAQYGLAGEIIAGASFILLALWDGRVAANAAGTAHTVAFRFARRAWLGSASDPAHQDLVPNLQPDLVYHIVASRRTSGPATGLTPLQEGYRCGPDGPLEAHLPESAVLVAERTAELNRDLLRHAASISRDTSTDDLTADLAAIPASVVDTARLFDAVDWLAGRMRRNVMRTLYATSALMVLMGVFFLAYNHGDDCSFCHYTILGFLAAFIALFGINILANASHWHRRYLEWRALAEGLRVELFWAVAGVITADGTPAVHRALLKQADPGLEWIPNAIRAVSLRLAELRPNGIVGGVDFAMRQWVGVVSETGSRSQQLHYYWHASRSKAALASFAERLAGVSVVIGFVVAFVLAGEELLGRRALHHDLLFCIGFFSLLGGVVEALVQKTAQRELQRQYEYMYAVFLAAHERLMAARTEGDRRAILSLLGRAALAEHAQWLLVHRDRPIDRSRMQ